MLTIRFFKIEEVGQDGQEKPVLYFNEETPGLVLNKTNSNIVSSVYGYETDEWVGKPLELYKDLVPFNGQIVAGIRVRIPPSPAPAGPKGNKASQPGPAPADEQTPQQLMTGETSGDPSLNDDIDV